MNIKEKTVVLLPENRTNFAHGNLYESTVLYLVMHAHVSMQLDHFLSIQQKEVAAVMILRKLGCNIAVWIMLNLTAQRLAEHLSVLDAVIL